MPICILALYFQRDVRRHSAAANIQQHKFNHSELWLNMKAGLQELLCRMYCEIQVFTEISNTADWSPVPEPSLCWV